MNLSRGVRSVGLSDVLVPVLPDEPKGVVLRLSDAHHNITAYYWLRPEEIEAMIEALQERLEKVNE